MSGAVDGIGAWGRRIAPATDAPASGGTTLGELVLCPSCGMSVSVSPGFSPWCDLCDWNLKPDPAPEPRGVIARFYRHAGRRMGNQLFESLKSSVIRMKPDARPEVPGARIGPANVAGIALAVAILLLPAGCAVIGVAFLTAGVNPIATPLALAFLGVGWELRPRIYRLPEGALDRSALPALFGLIDRIAKAQNAPTIDRIVFSSEFNAGVRRAGLRRRRTLMLGLPRWSVLEGQERVALLGHEIGHARSGNPLDMPIVATSIATLIALYGLILPFDGPRVRDRSFVGIVDILVAPFVWLGQVVLGQIVVMIAFIQLHLFWRGAQRCEYQADMLAAAVGGKRAAVGWLEKSCFAQTYYSTIRGLAAGARDRDPFTEFREAVVRYPERERERQRRIGRKVEARLDATHPPTAFRIDLVSLAPEMPPSVVLSASEESRIEAELAPQYAGVGRKALDLARDALYY